MKEITVPRDTPRKLGGRTLRRIGAFDRMGFPFVLAGLSLLGGAGALFGWISLEARAANRAPLWAAVAFVLIAAAIVGLTILTRKRRVRLIRDGTVVYGVVTKHIKRFVPWKSRSEPAALVEVEREDAKPIETAIFASTDVLEQQLPVGTSVPCIIDPIRRKAFGLFSAKHEIVLADTDGAEGADTDVGMEPDAADGDAAEENDEPND